MTGHLTMDHRGALCLARPFPIPDPMTRIINLRQARKSRDRDAKRAEGDRNAARFGEPKHLRDAREAEETRIRSLWDAHRKDDCADD